MAQDVYILCSHYEDEHHSEFNCSDAWCFSTLEGAQEEMRIQLYGFLELDDFFVEIPEVDDDDLFDVTSWTDEEDKEATLCYHYARATNGLKHESWSVRKAPIL